MKMANKKTKDYLTKICPPMIVYKLLDEYMIPSPTKEVIIATCIRHLDVYKGVDYLAKTNKVFLSRWQFSKRLSEGLQKIHDSHTFLGRNFLEFPEEYR